LMLLALYDKFLEWENNINNPVKNGKGSEDRFKLLSEATFEGICIHDQGMTIDANHQFADMFGYTVDEVKGMHCSNLIAPQSLEAVMNYISTGFQGPYEEYALRKDGTIFPVEVRAREFQQDDKTLRFAVFRDLSITKQAEDELKASEQRFKRLSETSFEAIAIHKEGKIFDVNQKYIEMFGYTSDELSHINGLDMIAPEYRETVMNHITSGYEEPYEVKGLKKDGTVFPIEIQAKASQIDGQAVRIGAIKDLTDQKEMERQIAESEKRYRELYDHSPIALYRTRISDGKLLECNQALIDLLGYDSKEEFQATSDAVARYTKADDRVVFLEKLKKDKRVEGFQVQVTRKCGKHLWIEMTAEMFPEQDYLEGAMQDITASKVLTQAERKVLRLVVEGMGNKQVARTLGRSVRTIEDHRSHLMKKLEVDSLAELVQKAKTLRPEA
jgi:PAS domain S-box-containing protein